METTPTRRQMISVVGVGGISLLAGCGGSGGEDESGGEQAAINEVALEAADSGDGDVLTVTLSTADGVDSLSLATAEGDELGTASVDGSTTVDLYTFESGPSDSYEITALDSSGSQIDQREWQPPSNVVIEEVSVERVEDFRQITIDVRNDAENSITATRAYVAGGFPLEVVSDGGDEDIVGRIAGLGGEKELPAGETTTIVMAVDAEQSAGAEGRLLNPQSGGCPGADEESIRAIELTIEFNSEPAKQIQVDVQFGGEYRAYYPYGCESVDIADWEEI